MSWMVPEGSKKDRKLTRLLQIATYTLTILLGLLTLVFPVISIKYIIGLHFTYLYAVLLAVGASGVLYGLLKPNYKTEKNFLWVLIGGWAIYDIALWGTFVARIVHPIPLLAPSYGPAIAVIIIILFLIRKYIFLRGEEKQLIKDSDRAGDS